MSGAERLSTKMKNAPQVCCLSTRLRGLLSLFLALFFEFCCKDSESIRDIKDSYESNSLFCLHAHAGSHPEGSGDGGKYGDQNVQDFSPDVLVFHL